LTEMLNFLTALQFLVSFITWRMTLLQFQSLPRL